MELRQYHRDFLRIAIFLHDCGHIADNERERAYLDGIHAELRAQVQARLQLRYPDHYDDDPYPFGVIFDAALFVLISHRQSSDTASELSPQPSELTPVLPVSTAMHTSHPNTIIPKSTPIVETIVQLEIIEMAVQEIISQVLHAVQSAVPTTIPSPVHVVQRPRAPKACIFYSEQHCVRDCQRVTQYISAGKCTQNRGNRIVLSNGNFVPKEYSSRNLAERIDTWNAQHNESVQSSAPPSLPQAIASESRSPPLVAALEVQSPFPEIGQYKKEESEEKQQEEEEEKEIEVLKAEIRRR
jgi:hypothetical protein